MSCTMAKATARFRLRRACSIRGCREGTMSHCVCGHPEEAHLFGGRCRVPGCVCYRFWPIPEIPSASPHSVVAIHRSVYRPDEEAIALSEPEPKVRIALDQTNRVASRIHLH